MSVLKSFHISISHHISCKIFLSPGWFRSFGDFGSFLTSSSKAPKLKCFFLRFWIFAILAEHWQSKEKIVRTISAFFCTNWNFYCMKCEKFSILYSWELLNYIYVTIVSENCFRSLLIESINFRLQWTSISAQDDLRTIHISSAFLVFCFRNSICDVFNIIKLQTGLLTP